MENSIRYVKLDFIIEFQNDAPVPAYKGSTFRGGIGDILLSEYCIRDGQCRSCSFRDTCVVPLIYYHPLKIVPPSVKDGGSLGYCWECLDRRTYVKQGDRMKVSLLLFGAVIVCFSTIFEAMYRLGMAGIGQHKAARFVIDAVYDQDHNAVFVNGAVNPRNIHVHSLMEDANGRCLGLEQSGHYYDLAIRFQSPWTQKWRNEFLTEFQLEAFADSVYRRCYLMHCMEGIESLPRREFDIADSSVITLDSGMRTETRYSNRQESRIHLKGIMGEYQLEHIPEDLLPYIFAGEIVHIGKNTSIGFGKYEILSCKSSQS